MKNKRGFLLAEETLKIVIAVIAIGFLIYFLVSLYYSHQNKKDLELAEASLEHLIEEINAGNTEVEIYNPDGWNLLSWPYGGEYPLSCSNLGWASCICICDTPTIKIGKNYLKNCEEKGICLENSKQMVVKVGGSQFPIDIEKPPITLVLDYGSKEITKK